MSFKLYKIRLIFVLIATFFLCQCTKAVNSSTPAPMPVENRKKIESPYSLPTAEYLAQAKMQSGQDQQNTLLLAAGRLIDDGQWRQGLSILTQTKDLTPIQMNQKHLLLAKIDEMRNRPKAVLAELSEIKEPASLTTYNQIQYHELFARAYRTEGQHLESINERIQLNNVLADEESKKSNLNAIWLTLTTVPQTELDNLTRETATNLELQGWLQLAAISRKFADNSKSLLAAVAEWQKHFYKHPANAILPNPLDSIAGKMLTQPKKIALLLPLTGPLSGPGTAIREGFMAAYNASNEQVRTKVQVYDTDKGEIAGIYQQALADGAEYVVGPLTKSQVAIIAATNHPVPTLLLNDAEVSLQDNSYLFGLSPSNEAIQVAAKAITKGYRRALIIAPNTDWGMEVTKAFSKQWQEKGAKIVATYSYSATEDMNKGMRDFLQISNSQEREKQIKQILGQHVRTTTNRRQDFDMIFLLAYPSKARQIMPLLKYYYAGDVPVYATSSAYGGSANALKDKDLDGLIFCDMPWVFSHQMGARNWPEQFNSYNRLYALGMDSYALSTQLNQLMVFSSDGTGAASGALYLKPSQQVARVLEWGQFRQGLAHSLGETA